MTDDLKEAYNIGLSRSKAARARGGKHRFEWTSADLRQEHVDGMSAVSEKLVALTTGRRWTSNGLVPDSDGADVEGGISVRWTPLDRGGLIVHKDEPDHLRCVLVVGKTIEAMRIVGWLMAAECKRREYWRDDFRHPAYLVPQHKVTRPITDLFRS